MEAEEDGADGEEAGGLSAAAAAESRLPLLGLAILRFLRNGVEELKGREKGIAVSRRAVQLAVAGYGRRRGVVWTRALLRYVSYQRAWGQRCRLRAAVKHSK